MVKSDIYDYINVLDRAADAAALRNKAIANNIANVDTPGYKRQDVSFAANLEEALRHSRFESLDDKISSVRLDRLKGKQYTDAEGYSYRLDGNNVDIETETVTGYSVHGIKLEDNNSGITKEYILESMKKDPKLKLW